MTYRIAGLLVLRPAAQRSGNLLKLWAGAFSRLIPNLVYKSLIDNGISPSQRFGTGLANRFAQDASQAAARPAGPRADGDKEESQ
jgi:hypothetical protein